MLTADAEPPSQYDSVNEGSYSDSSYHSNPDRVSQYSSVEYDSVQYGHGSASGDQKGLLDTDDNVSVYSTEDQQEAAENGLWSSDSLPSYLLANFLRSVVRLMN